MSAATTAAVSRNSESSDGKAADVVFSYRIQGFQNVSELRINGHKCGGEGIQIGAEGQKIVGQSSVKVARYTDGLSRQCLTLEVWLSALSGGKRGAEHGQRNTYDDRSESAETGATPLLCMWSQAP